MARKTLVKRVGAKPPESLFFCNAALERKGFGIALNLEEWESIRLVDYLDLEQTRAAGMMGVSRQTLQALLRSAHQKVARCLVEALPLRIEGGHYTLSDTDENMKEIRSERMKIAVCTQDGDVFEHFGRTPAFTIFEIEEGQIESETLLEAPAEGHGALTGFLKTEGVNVLICGGIGGGAVNALRAMGIELHAGASGKVRDQVQSFLAGQLADLGESNCNHHGHGQHGSCGQHHQNCGEEAVIDLRK
ncbi:MAG: NifB/NifX family molybdenum-iron cluster-binding protein [Anaerolineaceae bacterium]|nr:NifB/NifX family molybdenum-iron cluster-binding protein [Anaerolineaceae bacterium]